MGKPRSDFGNHALLGSEFRFKGPEMINYSVLETLQAMKKPEANEGSRFPRKQFNFRNASTP